MSKSDEKENSSSSLDMSADSRSCQCGSGASSRSCQCWRYPVPGKPVLARQPSLRQCPIGPTPTLKEPLPPLDDVSPLQQALPQPTTQSTVFQARPQTPTPLDGRSLLVPHLESDALTDADLCSDDDDLTVGDLLDAIESIGDDVRRIEELVLALLESTPSAAKRPRLSTASTSLPSPASSASGALSGTGSLLARSKLSKL